MNKRTKHDYPNALDVEIDKLKKEIESKQRLLAKYIAVKDEPEWSLHEE